MLRLKVSVQTVITQTTELYYTQLVNSLRQVRQVNKHQLDIDGNHSKFLSKIILTNRVDCPYVAIFL